MDSPTILALNVQELKQKLTELKLSTIGRKATLQDRLIEHYGLEQVQELEEENQKYSESDGNITQITTTMFTLRDIQESLNYFDGTGYIEIESWINEFEENAIAINWNDLQKFIYAKQLIKGAALAFLRSQSVNSWQELKEVLRREFGKKLSSIEIHKALEKRRKRRNESMLEYLYSLIAIGKPGNIDEQSIITHFIEGINDSKHNKLVLYDATTINEIKGKIMVYERMKAADYQPSGVKYERERCEYCPHLRNHSTAECKKGNKLCFKCNQKGHKAVNCQANMRQKNQGEKYKQAKTENPDAKQNETRPRMFRTYATDKMIKEISIQNHKFPALIDTGSDFTVIKKSVFNAIKEAVLIPEQMSINGIGQGKLVTLGKIVTEMKIDDISFTWKLHVVEDKDLSISLIGSDVLEILDMNITNNGVKVTLKEIKEKRESPKEENNIEKNIEDNIKNNIENNIEDNIGNNIENNIEDNIDFILGTEFKILCTSNDIEEHISTIYDIGSIEKEKEVELINIIESYKPDKTKQCPIEMNIVLTDDKPIYQHPRRISFSDQKLVEEQISDWLEAGIIKMSRSQYASPIVLVKKKNGAKRLCCDYRKLNEKIVRDNFPMNLIDDVLHKLSNAKVYTTLDLKDGYFHVPVHENSQKYTSFVTHHGQFEFCVVPFGISNAPAEFCRFISIVFHDLIRSNTIIVYMDDIIIPSETIEENIEKVKQVFSQASTYGLEINFKKCQFLKEKINFLGYIIENTSIKPSEEKTLVVKNFPLPQDVKALQRFLGLTSYFRKFIENYAFMAKPLTDMLGKGQKFKMEDNEIFAFNQLKTALIQAPVLTLFKQGAVTEVHTDASMHGYGATLMQKDSATGQFHPVEYMSRKTTKAEEVYHSYELEVLAVIQALKKWRTFLQDIHFKIITDCKAFSMTINKKEVPVRVARWIMFLQDFNYKVEHRAGTKMKHVDALSRMYALLAQSPLKQKIIEAQNKDSWTKALREVASKNLSTDYFLKYDILHKDAEKQLIVIPETLEREVLETAHKQGHFSAKKIAELVQKEYFIPNIQEKAKNVVRSCIPCILAEKKSGKKEGFLNPIEKTDRPFDTFHIDHVGPLETTKKQYNHIFTVVDGFSKFTWLFPTRSTGSSEVIESLQKIANIFGNPRRIISDKGAAFTSNDFKNYCQENEIQHNTVTTGAPRGNGQVERMHKIVLTILTKLTIGNEQHWYKHLSKIQQFINNTPTRSTKIAPYKILTGLDMRIKEDKRFKDMLTQEQIKEIEDNRTEMRQTARNNIKAMQNENVKAFNRKRKEDQEYEVGELVAIKRTQFGTGLKIKRNYLGPYKVTKKKRLGRYAVEKVGEEEGPIRTSTLAEYMKPWSPAFETNTMSGQPNVG